jgi:hypothetical protein
MVTIIVETNWPAESTKQLAEVWLGMPEIPEQMKMHYVGVKGEADCTRGMVIWQVEDSFVAQALGYIRNDIARYFDVPGFGYTVSPWTEAADALQSIGMG